MTLIRNLVVAVSLGAAAASAANSTSLPSLQVPACPEKGTIKYNLTSPDQVAFPNTAVEVCYDNSSIQISFLAYNETSFYYNPNDTTNGAISDYEVMEVFISKGTSDPQTYLEFEVNPNNITFQGFIYNPSLSRVDGAPFDVCYIADPLADGLLANTTLDVPNETWFSSVTIPLGLFNVFAGDAQGTQWRMNFFRITTSPETYPTRISGAWSPLPDNNLHNTPYFGSVEFI